MKQKRPIFYLMLLAGAAILLFAQDDVRDQWPILILGIALLMGGLFGINSGIKGEKPEQSFIQSEEEE